MQAKTDVVHQQTREQAADFPHTLAYQQMTDVERAVFQLHQIFACMPFPEVRRCMEIALKRPILAHEYFRREDELLAEIASKN